MISSTLTIKIPALLRDQWYPHTFTLAKSALAGTIIANDVAGGVMTAFLTNLNFASEFRTLNSATKKTLHFSKSLLWLMDHMRAILLITYYILFSSAVFTIFLPGIIGF
jgi:hypothetical protein